MTIPADRRALLERAAATGLYRGVGRDWAAVPPTSRAALVRDQLAHPPLGSRRHSGAALPVRAGASGSGDDLLVLAWSEHELALERRAGTRLLGRFGVRPQTPVANTLPGALVSPGSLLLGDVVEELGALDVPLGSIDNEAAAKPAWELVDRVQPAVIVLEAATAGRFLAAAPPAPRPWLEGLVWLRRAGAVAGIVPVAAGVGFEGWQRQWLAVPEASSFAAAECTAGVFHPDEGLLVEVLDGRLVLTPTEGDAALLRFDCGLAARALEGRCSCGADGAIEIDL